MAGATMLAVGYELSPTGDSLALTTWLVIVSCLSAWTILATNNSRVLLDSGSTKRRLAMLILGLICGAAAVGLQQLLLVSGSNPSSAHAPSVIANGQLPAYLVLFGAIFMANAWWKKTDPLRRTRVNLISLGGCVFIAWLVQLAWPDLQPWGMISAALISLAVQCSAPWMNSTAREIARKEFRRV